MFLLDTLSKILFYLFLAGSSLGIGLKTGKEEILSVVCDKGWLVRMVAANFLLIPALGVAAARFLAMKPENAAALILLACAPGGLSALQFLTKNKDAEALAYGGGTTALLSLLSILVSPALISLALPGSVSLTVPYGKAILFVSLFMFVPLLLGVIVHGTARAAAAKIAGPASWVGTLAFLSAMIKLSTVTKWAKAGLGKRGLLIVVAFILVSMLLGWVLGGPRKLTRPILATSSSMRNIALALAIAVRSTGLAVLTPLVAYASIMITCNLLFTLAVKAAVKMAEKRSSSLPA